MTLPQLEEPKSASPKSLSSRGPLLWAAGAGAVVIAIILIAGLYIADRYGVVRPFTQEAISQATAVSNARPPLQTEAYFINGLKSQPAAADEWWGARSDHKLLAYAVLNCKRLTNFALDAMPRQYFSALLLDLDPTGNHVFFVKDGDDTALARRDIDAAPLALTNADQQLLSLSDSIARARLSAADGANSNVPWVQRLGLTTVIISALATLFVTLQGKTRAVELTDEEKKTLDNDTAWTRFSHAVAGPGSGFRWVAFMAIVLSITGTALTGLKQVYDPSRILTQNTRALLDLRQLHQDVILSAACNPVRSEVAVLAARQKKLTEWTSAIRRIRATILPEYGAYANLDVGGSSQRPDPTGIAPADDQSGATQASLDVPPSSTSTEPPLRTATPAPAPANP